MSLRPRPVTATVTKPKWMEPQVLRRRSPSLESTGSTASLTSVLDHDSYVSPYESDEDWEEDKTEDKTEDQTDTDREIIHKLEEQNLKENVKSKPKMRRKLADFEDNTDISNSQEAEDKLSPWEKWLITKTKNERFKRKLNHQQKKEEKLKQETEEKEKQITAQRAEEKRQKWLEEKNYEERLRKKMEKKRLKTEKELDQEKKRTIMQQSSEKFNKWQAEKNKQLKENLKLQKQRSKEEEIEQHQRKLKAEQKYQEWLKNSKNRPKSAPNSYGYTSGKLTGYHDTSAYPAPSFYNPQPWHHNPVPNKTTEKNKKLSKTKTKKKYVWNPEKYY